MQCAKGDFPHAQYAVYLHAIDARRAVKCGIEAVTWCDITANQRGAAHSIPHFTFRIPHAAVPHFTHSPKLAMRCFVSQFIVVLAAHALAPLVLSAARCEECRFVYTCSHLCKCNIKVRRSQNTTVHRACHTDRNSVTEKRKHMLCNDTYT